MRVLIAVDGTDAGSEVVEHAYRAFGADAHYSVVSVGEVRPYAYPSTPLGVQPSMLWITDEPGQTPREIAERAAEQAVHDAEDVGLADVEVLSEAGSPGPVICDLAEQRGMDVIVVGAVARGWLSRLVTPSVRHYVVDHAPCDVLIVRGHDVLDE